VAVRCGLLIGGILLSSTLVGCSGEAKDDVSKERLEQMAGGALKEVVPVSGKVLVDGTPEKGVSLFLYSTTSSTQVATCTTGENGEYCWSTYLTCDGIPPGDYKVGFTFVPDQKKNDEGVDIFKGKYQNPKDPQFQFTVASGAPVKDKNFELKTN
jgi:hypothetical protein